MHYSMGKEYVRRHYMEELRFLSDKYDSSEVYVQTTDSSRTIYSALSQLDGIYGRPLAFPETDPLFVIDPTP